MKRQISKKKSIWETGVRGLLTLHINHNHPNTHCQRSSLTHFFIKTYKFNYYSLFRLVQSSGRVVAACRTIYGVLTRVQGHGTILVNTDQLSVIVRPKQKPLKIHIELFRVLYIVV